MTMQIPDILVWRGVEHTLISGGIGLKTIFPEVEIPLLEKRSSACWRGYIETWIIDDKDWLRISRIDYFADFIDNDESPNQLYLLIPNYDSPIAALGFSGDVTAGYGEDVKSHGLYAESYPNYRVFNFDDGKLINVVEHDRAWWEKDNEAFEMSYFFK